MAGSGRRRKRPKADRNLYLRGGIWWTRITWKNRATGHEEEKRESTGCPKMEVASARQVRDKRLARIAEQSAGIEQIPDPMRLGEVIDLYLKLRSNEYDREKGGEQPGTKRSAEADRSSKKRVLAHLDRQMSGAAVTPETLFMLAEAIERETPLPAPATRRKTFAFLRGVYAWARENPSATGITQSPFNALSSQQRRRIFPKPAKRSFIYAPEQLVSTYEQLPEYARPFVRFAVHTGMRLREITTLICANVDLSAGVAHVEARFAKNGKARDVALGSVAVSILEEAGVGSRLPSEHVFMGRRGQPIRDVRGAFDKAVLGFWKPSRPGERKPRFHDLRKTGATRVEAVSSHAIAKAFLGHGDLDVTDQYVVAELGAVRDAVNRAARSIDGEIPPGTLAFPATKTAHQTAQSKIQPSVTA